MIKKVSEKRTAFAVLLILVFSLSACISGRPNLERAADNSNVPVLQPLSSTKILLVTGEYAPYTSTKLPSNGFFTHIVSTVFQEMKLEYEIRFFPWARCEEMVRNGEAWASFPYGSTEKRVLTFFSSAPIYSARHKFFVLKSNSRLGEEVRSFRNIGDFGKYTMGGTNGYWYGSRDDLKKKGVQNVEWADDVDGLVRMAYNQRIDVFIEDELVGWDAIRRIYPGNAHEFSTLRNDALPMEYALIVSKTYPRSAEILERFNLALSNIKERKVLDTIVKMHQKDQ